MMESYKLFVLCVVLCTVHSGHSYSVRGTIQDMNDVVQEVNVSNYVNGENLYNIWVLTLDRLEGAKTLPTLTIANFASIYTLKLTNIAVENVPVFVKTRCREIFMTGNKIKSVPASAFSVLQPEYLDLSNNEIQSMADRSINIRANFVYLSCNQLSNFSESWFEDLDNVETLDLRGNRIVQIQDRGFNQMTRLRWLHLSYNRITSIGNEAFSAEIAILDLQFNNIVQLTPSMFARRDKPISMLFLHHNQLSQLPEALLLKVKPEHISLEGNPWQCQCLRDLERWLRELNSMRWDIPGRRGEPVCVVPLSFQNVCMPAVDTELQQTYAKGLSPVSECLASPCKPCTETKDLTLTIAK